LPLERLSAMDSEGSPSLDQWAMSLFSDEPKLLALAKRVSEATGAPILGGIAVFLHGYRRTTQDIDLYAEDPEQAAAALEGLGAKWDPGARQHVLDGVPIHLVTDKEVGGPPAETVELRGCRVVSLADLIRLKLESGLDRIARAKDLADVVELIRALELDKEFAAKLPKPLRKPFKRLVEAVRP
jgi:hypothetical protein